MITNMIKKTKLAKAEQVKGMCLHFWAGFVHLIISIRNSHSTSASRLAPWMTSCRYVGLIDLIAEWRSLPVGTWLTCPVWKRLINCLWSRGPQNWPCGQSEPVRRINSASYLWNPLEALNRKLPNSWITWEHLHSALFPESYPVSSIPILVPIGLHWSALFPPWRQLSYTVNPCQASLGKEGVAKSDSRWYSWHLYDI